MVNSAAPLPSEEGVQPRNAAGGHVSCPQCGRVMKRQGDLTRHMRSHAGLKPYSCPQCSVSFTRARTLRLHYYRVHPPRAASDQPSHQTP